MSGHTPGPWEVGKLAHTVLFGHEHGGCLSVPMRTGMHDTRAEAEANARLIAAAPELLALVEWIDQHIRHEDDCPRRVVSAAECLCIRSTVSALIAQVEG